MEGKPQNDSPSDETLVRSARQGDRAAFELLLRRYAPPLMRFACARTRSPQDAEDIVQDTLLRAFENLASYNPAYPLKNWLFTIAYRCMVSAARRKRPSRLSEEAAANLPAAETDPTATGDWLWDHVGQMNPADHTVLWLRYQQDMSVEEIAKITQKTPIGVRVRLHRARGRLARTLSAAAESNEPLPAPLRAIFCMERT